MPGGCSTHRHKREARAAALSPDNQAGRRVLAAAVSSACVSGQGTASYGAGCALVCAWLDLEFKMYIFIKCAAPCGRPALSSQANSFLQLSEELAADTRL